MDIKTLWRQPSSSLALGSALLFVMVASAPAQVTIDVAQITCRQFLLDKVAPTKSIALWLAGYYNGKRNNTVIDPNQMERNVDKVEDYCRLNLDITVMQAVEATLGLK
jgi:acid stress chaperone HdeB